MTWFNKLILSRFNPLQNSIELCQDCRAENCALQCADECNLEHPKVPRQTTPIKIENFDCHKICENNSKS